MTEKEIYRYVKTKLTPHYGFYIFFTLPFAIAVLCMMAEGIHNLGKALFVGLFVGGCMYFFFKQEHDKTTYKIQKYETGIVEEKNIEHERRGDNQTRKFYLSINMQYEGLNEIETDENTYSLVQRNEQVYVVTVYSARLNNKKMIVVPVP